MIGCFYLAHVITIPVIILNVFSLLSILLIIVEIYLIFANKETKLYRILNPTTFYFYPVIIGLTSGYGFSSLGLDLSPKQYQFLMTAFIDTCAIFAVFTVFSLLTNKRTKIYIGASLFGLVLSIINIFVFNVMLELVLGIVIACLYVIVDTQNIILKCAANSFNVFGDAKNLFVDFVKIMIDIFRLLNKIEEEREKKKNK